MIHTGDCLDVMAGMQPESVDAIVTDPPYGLEFMGMAWDQFDGRENGTARPRNEWGDFGSREHARGQDDLARVNRKKAIALQRFSQTWAEAAYRVAKPSAYLLAFGGTRTVHRMTVALEDAGWIIRDMLVWAYASGFPKSKASLKPAWEPIVMARKPGPLRMLAIDLCRIPMSADDAANIDSKHAGMDVDAYERPVGTSLQLSTDPMPLKAAAAHELGRWPANLLLTDPIFDGGVEGVVGGGEASASPSGTQSYRRAGTSGWRDQQGMFNEGREWTAEGYGDSGTYSRFFLIPKADRADREPVLGGHGLTEDIVDIAGLNAPEQRAARGVTAPYKARANIHPTVKPVDLMRHLVRLVTPTGGTVLDPFLGSGTTAIAAEMEGFPWIGIEREAEYVAIAEARLNGVQKGFGLAV